MPIIAAELIAYGSAVMPEDDTTTGVGAAIATLKRVGFEAALAADDTLDVVSDDGGDTRTVTIHGRLASGAIDTEVYTLVGTTQQIGAKTFERILKVVTTSGPTETITIEEASGSTTVILVPPLTTEVRRTHYDSVSSGSAKDVYEKLFWKNTHGTLTLTNPFTTLNSHVADPDNGVRIGVATTINDTGTTSGTTDRVDNPPTGVTFVDDGTDQAVASDLAAADAIGIWIELRLGANDAAFKGNYVHQLKGTTV